MKKFTISTKPVECQTVAVEPPNEHERGVFSRQSIITNYSQEKFNSAKVGVVGLGIGGHYSIKMARMGIGHIVISDFDYIEYSNLNRQPFKPTQAKYHMNKALALADNLKQECMNATKIEAYPLAFQKIIERYPKAFLKCNHIFCAVDNEKTRHDVSKYAFQNKIPVIFCAVSRLTINGQVIVQKVNGACISCFRSKEEFERNVEDTTIGLDGTTRCFDPAINDIQTAVLGFGLFAGRCFIINQKFNWNEYLVRFYADSYAIEKEPKKNCEICSK
jgi:molybdopterin/thiamine biosynthesis adenylyltransferase